MSSDNRMVVESYYEDIYCTYMELGDEPYTMKQIESALYFKTFKDKLKAIEYAAFITKHEIVEYGIEIRC